MKRLLTGFFILVFLFSCGNRKTKMDPFATITEMVDSAGHEADTLQQAEVKEEPEHSFEDRGTLLEARLPVYQAELLYVAFRP